MSVGATDSESAALVQVCWRVCKNDGKKKVLSKRMNMLINKEFPFRADYNLSNAFNQFSLKVFRLPCFI